ncbi:MAG: sn-glycerol-1-phosphate dehydrogenase [Candidatus Lokiarchaeota archaeon]|nr:sn-glycerol-1-phosphate dehydrogenase [Candidatus Lokiarchaeota archaeon]
MPRATRGGHDRTKYTELVNVEGCPCGRAHSVHVDSIDVGHGTIEGVPGIARRLGGSGPVGIICDGNTFQAAGRRVEQLLSAGRVPSDVCELRADGHVVPDEKALDAARHCISRDTRLLLAVGSGTITDITRFIASEMHVPFVSIPTAPSVDGFVSSVSAIITQGLKTSYPASPPCAVVADLDVLASAPDEMKAAGFGDLLGKSTARMDWELSRVMNKEYHCARTACMVQTALDGCVRAFRLKKGYDEEMVHALIEGLLWSSLSAAMVGSTRPISGSEHHVSHFLEMKGLSGHVPEHLHGETVAVGTYIVSALYHEVFSLEYDEFKNLALDSTHSRRSESRERRLLAAYGPLGERMVGSWRSSMAGRSEMSARMGRISESWDELASLRDRYVFSLPALEKLMGEASIPLEPAELGYTMSLLEDAILCARLIRDRYTILSFLDDFSLLEHFCSAVLGKLDIH